MIEIPVSIGEVIDKITILQIKKEKIQDDLKLKNINNELDILQSKISSIKVTEEIFYLTDQLKKINYLLWEVEDRLRIFEEKNAFDNEFISNARLVYKLNDQRFFLKKKINILTQSSIVEEKSYYK